jgi:hypothetical protein
MKIDTITLIASAALLALALFVLYTGYLRRRHRVRRLVMTDLLRDYFRGGMPPHILRSRIIKIANRHFTTSNEFYALAIAAFQNAADSTLASREHVQEKERKLLNALANLEQTFGLTDRYQLEAWRPWRE